MYGFGIFLYIIYLFFKLTSKDKPHRQECRFPTLQSECTFEEMPTCQLGQLQARMSEKVREKRISKVVHPTARSRRGTRRREEKKLKQLKEITQMMRERQLREGATPEEEAEEAPYTADWEGYTDETYPEYDMISRRRRFPSVILEEPDQAIPTAEELAERMEKEEEDELTDDACTNEEVEMDDNEGEKEEDDKDEEDEDEEVEEDDELEDNDEEEEEEEEDEEDVGEDQPCLPKGIDEDNDRLENPSEREEQQKPSGRRRQITFSDHRHVFHYPKGGAVGCKYEEEEEEEHEREDEEGNEEEENGDEDYEEEEEEEEENSDEEEGDQCNEERQDETEEKEEEDPLMEAESLGFNDDVECDPEEQEVDLLDFLQSYQPEVTVISNKSESTKAQASGTLRMRHKKQKVKK